MRVLTERLKGRELDLTDGIKVLDERGWAEVLPDPDEPLIHVYAEGATRGGLRRARGRAARAGRGCDAGAGNRRRSANLKLRLNLCPAPASMGIAGRFDRRDVMEALPDLAGLSDAELKDLIKQLEDEENEISYRRRLLHGKLDILRAELVARLQKKGEGSSARSTSTG